MRLRTVPLTRVEKNGQLVDIPVTRKPELMLPASMLLDGRVVPLRKGAPIDGCGIDGCGVMAGSLRLAVVVLTASTLLDARVVPLPTGALVEGCG